MKVDLTKQITNFDGESISSGANNGNSITVGLIVRNALGAGAEKESGDQKLKKFKIGLKCVADKPDLSAEEINVIVKAVEAMGATSLIYGRVIEALDPDRLKD